MKKSFTSTINGGIFTLLVVVSPFSLAQAAAPLSGAIFTTVRDGTIVNANTQYTSKCAVYLDGGPGPNAPAKAAGLPAGEYYFQVTDPNGQTLLSTDVVNNRRFRVSANGVITAYTGMGGPVHPTGIDQDHPELGAITIRLANLSCPTDYLNTPNSGGVYKVWVTPVDNFVGDRSKVDNPCGNGCFHGFASSTSKTDNFKVQPTIPTFCISIKKQIVDGPDTITPGVNWPVAVTDPTGVTNNLFTNDTDGTLSVCGLVAGSYTVTESEYFNEGAYEVIRLRVNEMDLPKQPVYSFTWKAGQPGISLVFKNFLIPVE